MYRTLTGRLLLPFIGLIMALNILVYHVLDLAIEGTLEQGMSTILGKLGDDTSNFDQAFEAFSTGEYDVDEFYFRLFDPGGDLAISEGPELPQAASLAMRVEPGDRRSDTVAVDAQTQLRVVTRRLADGSVIQAGLLLDQDDTLFEQFALHWRLGVLALTLQAAGLAWWIARRAMGGVREVTRTAEEILEGSLEARVPETQQVVEVKELTATVNRMLDRIDLLITNLKYVTVDIAHDLRSPLTRIRGAAEVALRGDGSPAHYETLAVRAIEETTRLEVMIATMLDIARMDTGDAPLAKEPIDPTALISEVMELYSESAEAKRLSMHFDRKETAWIEGERASLQRALANLLDNALKFTPEGGSIQLGTLRKGEAIVIFVEDSGPGIAAEEIPRLFERFYRADDSRNVPGHGLGLSYVKAVMTAHGGRVHVVPATAGGARLELCLPVGLRPEPYRIATFS